ncbi:FkbM family methyltransferase [Brevundimonas sp.]|uniref:FkbM family methyltransferase n=1 Tax=Brevundimonas sp. TaxID=1871086 RepID=UPI003A92A587
MEFFGFALYRIKTARHFAKSGDAARDRGNWRTAVRRYQSSLSLDDSRTDLWVQLGHALKETGDRHGAEAAYVAASQRAPDAADPHLQLGHLFKLTQRWAEAADAFGRVLRSDPTCTEAAAELHSLAQHGVFPALGTVESNSPVQSAKPPVPPATLEATRLQLGRRHPSRTARKRRLRLPVPSRTETRANSAPVEAVNPLAANVESQRYFPLGHDLGLTRLQDGHFLYVDPMDEAVAAHLIARGYWENWIHKVVCALVQPGDSIIEVGANFGYYTVAMAREAGPEGSILAFEANPGLAELVRRTVHFNGYSPTVKVIAKAASDKAGTLSFATSRRNAGGGTISTKPQALGPDSMLVTVETITLDSIAPDGVRFIRMDAEGSEPLILRGAERLLQRPDIVVCMEWDVVQMSARADLDALIGWLSGLGFRYWSIQYDSTLLSIPAADMANLPACDVVMAREVPAGVTVAES